MLKIKRKTLLYKTNVEYGDFSINHVEGCSHGCRFPCYAFLIKRRSGAVKDYSEWLKPKIVENTLELLEKEIPKYSSKIKFVHLCFATDPFMYNYPEVSKLTLKIIKRLNRDEIKCTILTKGVLPKKLIDSTKYSKENEYGITIVSLDRSFKDRFEPYSADYLDRIKSLEYLHNNGLKTWVSIEPYPPLTLVKQNLNKILEKITFVDKIIFGKLNYNGHSLHLKSEEYKKFYDICADEIISFCKKLNIEYHIKFGTKNINDFKTSKIFYSNL